MTPQPTSDNEGGPPSDEASRMWSHLLHEDNMFMQRGNFFLVAQSMLLVAYSALAEKLSGSSTAAQVVSAFGVLLALAWAYIGHRQRQYVHHVTNRVMESAAEFRTTQKSRPVSPASTTAVLAYVLPVLTLIVWVALALSA